MITDGMARLAPKGAGPSVITMVHLYTGNTRDLPFGSNYLIKGAVAIRGTLLAHNFSV